MVLTYLVKSNPCLPAYQSLMQPGHQFYVTYIVLIINSCTDFLLISFLVGDDTSSLIFPSIAELSSIALVSVLLRKLLCGLFSITLTTHTHCNTHTHTHTCTHIPSQVIVMCTWGYTSLTLAQNTSTEVGESLVMDRESIVVATGALAMLAATWRR